MAALVGVPTRVLSGRGKPRLASCRSALSRLEGKGARGNTPRPPSPRQRRARGVVQIATRRGSTNRAFAFGACCLVSSGRREQLSLATSQTFVVNFSSRPPSVQVFWSRCPTILS